MAVVEYIKSNTISVKLNTGTSPTGTVITKSVPLSGLKKTVWDSATDNQKAMNIINALAPCLDYSVYRIDRGETVQLDEE